MREISAEEPVSFTIDYPERLDRLTTLFRVFTIIPIAIILFAISGVQGQSQDGGMHYQASAAGGILIAPVVLMLLFRRKYPRWWFDWNVALTQFGARVGAYALLLRDEYPSTDDEQAVHLAIRYPDAQRELNRWLPLIKWFLAIPHYIVLAFLWIAVFFVTVVAWFAILFTGQYPRGLFDFVVDVLRWDLRVAAYMALLTTDRYPPFSLGA